MHFLINQQSGIKLRRLIKLVWKNLRGLYDFSGGGLFAARGGLRGDALFSVGGSFVDHDYDARRRGDAD